jgi:hypothetical protein
MPFPDAVLSVSFLKMLPRSARHLHFGKYVPCTVRRSLASSHRLFEKKSRLLPNRRASMDHAPGPIIAKHAASVAAATAFQGSPSGDEILEIPIHPSTITVNAPTTGVKKPIIRTTPAAIPKIWSAPDTGGEPAYVQTIPEWISATPVSKRKRRRPAPGQPSANVENNRCMRTRFKSM